MKQVLIFILFVVCLTAVQVNVMTSFIVNEAPFSEEIVCTDCVEPVTITAQGLPQFITLDGSKLVTTADPTPGQYHVVLNVEDGAGQTARVLVILLCQDEKTSGTGGADGSIGGGNNGGNNGGNRGGDTTISIYSPQLLANLTTLLVDPSTITESQLRIQTILGKQAAINSKIANLLILIRRYTAQTSKNKEEVDKFLLQFQNLLTQQTDITTELLDLESKLNANRKSIKELIEFIKKMRAENLNQRNKKQEAEKIYQTKLEELNNKISRKNSLEQIISIRQEALENLTSQTGGCQQQTINEQNQIIDQINSNQTKYQQQLDNTQQQLAKQDGIISDLEKQLMDARKKRDQLMRDRYFFSGKIESLQDQKLIAIQLLQKLEATCNSQVLINPTLIQRLEDIIKQLKDELVQVNDQITNLSPQIKDLSTTIDEIDSVIDYNIDAIDQAIDNLESLYNDNDVISVRIAELKAKKEEFDAEIVLVRIQLQEAIKGSDNNSLALKNARQQLQIALREKEANDQQILGIFNQNLDIIQALEGRGDYNFNMSKLKAIIGDNIGNIDFSQVYDLQHTKQGNQTCVNDVVFYGIGEIISTKPGVITIATQSGTPADLHTPTCSVNLSTKQNYTPKAGDALCWLGYKDNSGKWFIRESIIVPSSN